MRSATIEFLKLHGWSDADARARAARHLVFWLSVHDATSEHEPHVTEDALVGGVYYVHLGTTRPQLLGLYDPRGKRPLGLTAANAKHEPAAPFHRITTITPRAGLLLLFPGMDASRVQLFFSFIVVVLCAGWLVHAVMPRDKTSAHHIDANRPYRVSVSVNLKGEWQDTGNLILRA
jgi:hypothetical protein